MSCIYGNSSARQEGARPNSTGKMGISVLPWVLDWEGHRDRGKNSSKAIKKLLPSPDCCREELLGHSGSKVWRSPQWEHLGVIWGSPAQGLSQTPQAELSPVPSAALTATCPFLGPSPSPQAPSDRSLMKSRISFEKSAFWITTAPQSHHHRDGLASTAQHGTAGTSLGRNCFSHPPPDSWSQEILDPSEPQQSN